MLPSRVLLRVRMLYYLRQEVIGDQAEKVLGGAIARYGFAVIFTFCSVLPYSQKDLVAYFILCCPLRYLLI